MQKHLTNLSLAPNSEFGEVYTNIKAKNLL
jgi:hypothetical protein